MSSESIITKKGQITIPANLRAELNLQPGKKVKFVKTSEGLLIIPSSMTVKMLKGILKTKEPMDKIEAKVKEIQSEWEHESNE